MKDAQPQIISYKKFTNSELKMHIFQASEKNSPALVGFHGGGWVEGTPEKWYALGRFFQAQGISVFLAEYRFINQQTKDLWDIVEDAHSALAWVHENADTYSLDKGKIGVGGGSAGAHLAFCTALIAPRGGNTKHIPDFILAYNPVIDTSTEGFGNAIAGPDWKLKSPLHQLKGNCPPCAIFQGTADPTTPLKSAQAFHVKSRELGNVCELYEYEGRAHGFFNQEPDFSDVAHKSILFLNKLYPL